MRIWLTTDTHFGHKYLIDAGIRPSNYESLICDNLNCVSEDDLLIHLGDFIFYDSPYIETFKNIKCKKCLVLGNHDKKSYSWYMSYFDIVVNRMEIWYYGINIVFSHKPTKMDKGINIFGHFHNSGHRNSEYEGIIGGNNVMLALENVKYRPVLLDSVVKRLDKLKVHEFGYKIITQ